MFHVKHRMERKMNNQNSKEAFERAKILLKATYDLLQKQKNCPYVLDILCETAIWDSTEYDGYCLYDDIVDWFNEFGDENEYLG